MRFGSAAIAHAAAKTKEPVAEGLVALLEPFVDTVVVCTTTALVIVISGVYLGADGVAGITLTSAAFEQAFSWFPYVLAVAVALFAFSTSVTWFYYGERAFLYLFGYSVRGDNAYKAVFLILVVAGSTLNLSAAYNLADAVLLGMAFPNIAGLYIMAPEVKAMLKDYLARVKSGAIATTS